MFETAVRFGFVVEVVFEMCLERVQHVMARGVQTLFKQCFRGFVARASWTGHQSLNPNDLSGE